MYSFLKMRLSCAVIQSLEPAGPTILKLRVINPTALQQPAWASQEMCGQLRCPWHWQCCKSLVPVVTHLGLAQHQSTWIARFYQWQHLFTCASLIFRSAFSTLAPSCYPTPATSFAWGSFSLHSILLFSANWSLRSAPYLPSCSDQSLKEGQFR